MNSEQRIEGPTPNGGVYTIAYFLDSSGNPADRTAARQVLIIEYDDKDEPVFRTYGILNSL